MVSGIWKSGEDIISRQRERHDKWQNLVKNEVSLYELSNNLEVFFFFFSISKCCVCFM